LNASRPAFVASLLVAMLLPASAMASGFTELDRGRGLRLYGNYCIACHDHDGRGSVLARTDIKADMPVLLESDDATPARYFRQIFHGGGGMPQMHDELSETDIWNIVYAIPLIRQKQHSEWVPEKFERFKLEVKNGRD